MLSTCLPVDRMFSLPALLSLLASCLLPASAQQEFTLPSYVDVCYRDDPKVAECIKRDIEKLVPLFKSGSADFDLASLDPMMFKDLVFNYKSPIIGGHLEIPSLAAEGLAKVKVTNIRPKLKNPDKFILDFSGHIPQLKLKGPYSLAGNVLTIPVSMTGLIDFVLEKVDLTYHIQGDVENIGDYQYLDLDTFNFRFRGEGVSSAYVAGNRIVDDRPALNEAVITVLNNNWRILKDNLSPVLYPVSDKLMRDYFKDLFKKYPYDVLFPRRTRTSPGTNRTLSLE